MTDMRLANLDSILGRMVVEKGLATPEEVEQCRRLQRKAEDPNQKSLANVLVTRGVVTKRQIERLRPLAEEQGSSQQIPGYHIMDRLGAGAMATVYKARQLSLDRLVAVKVLPQKHTNNQQFVERFYAEGKAAAQLNHPNIVGALDVGQSAGYHYFVMEYVEGKTVYDELLELGQYDERRALDIVMQVTRALDHAHKAGFIHRDVKPKNIMITPSGAAKLADMGLARAVSDREAAEAEQGKAFGTPYYISPEQVRGDVNVDFRADIYSLGATFYHMVTGRVPFEGPNPSAVMHKHLRNDPVPPDHINPSLSAGIGEIIEVCMAKDPNKRYSNAAELLDDLEAVAAGGPPVQARRRFDLSSLTNIENSGRPNAEGTADIGGAEPLYEQPLFWAALLGWILVGILMTVLIVTMLGD